MGLTFPNTITLHKATLLFLLLLLIFLPLFSAIRNLQPHSDRSGLTGNIDVLPDMSQFLGPIPHFPKNLRVDLGTILLRNDNTDTWSLTCWLCNVYIRAGVGGAPVAPPEKLSSEKKPNVGAVVGYTILLVFLLVITFVCIYRNRRSESQWTVQQVVVQPGVPRVENPPQGRQQVEMLAGHNRGDQDCKDDKKQLEEKVEGPKGNGDDNKEGKKRPQDKVVGRRERVKDGNVGKELPHEEKVVVQPKRVREGKQQEEAPRDEGVARQNKREIMEGKKQELAPRDEGAGKQKVREVEGKQQVEPPRDEGVAKRKKRGREGKQQQPLEEDVGRQYKRGKEEEQNGKGVEAKEEPEKEQFEGQQGKGRDRKQPREVVIEQGNSLGVWEACNVVLTRKA